MAANNRNTKPYGILGEIDEARQGILGAADRSPLAITLGGVVARQVGQSVGLATGAAKTFKGIADGTVFLSRLSNPLDNILSAPGQSAMAQLGQAGAALVYKAGNAVAHPEQAAGAVRKKVKALRAAIDPSATPVAKTFSAELARNLTIGKNQGELAFDLGSLAFGGAAVKGLKGAAAVSEAAAIAKFTRQGFTPAAAKYLSEPYSGMGSHYFPRTLPKKIGDINIPASVRNYHLPKSIGNSIFNVLKPKNINRGDMYELHFSVDDRFHGTGLPARFGRKGWSGSKLGLKRHDLPGRLWHGAPPHLKGAISGVELGGVGYRHLEDDQ